MARARSGHEPDHDVLMPWIAQKAPQICSTIAVLEHRIGELEGVRSVVYETRELKQRVHELEQEKIYRPKRAETNIDTAQIATLVAFAAFVWLGLWPADLSMENIISVAKQIAGAAE